MTIPSDDSIALEFAQAVIDHSRNTERSQVSADNRIGVSDLGVCRERVRRTILREEPSQEVTKYALAAFVGTVTGDKVEEVMKERHPEWVIQQELEIPLPNGYTLIGHCDIIATTWNAMLDGKTVNGLDLTRRKGATDQQQFQRHLYAWGAIKAGLLQEEGCVVGNVWFDRSAEEHVPHVQTEPFDYMWVQAASDWLDDVIYAIENDEEASKDPAREFCWAVCEFAPSCRGQDTDVSGLITDEDQLVATKMYLEANEMEREAKRMKNKAKIALKETSGSTGEHTVRWIHVNPSEVSYIRDAYQRLDIRPVKKRSK